MAEYRTTSGETFEFNPGAAPAPRQPSAWPGLLGPVLTGVATLGGAIYSAKSAEREAQKNRDFQERMSSTAHQREVADLVAAGLNPALSAMRGGGASTPSGSMGQVPDYARGLSSAVQNALVMRSANAQIELTKAQADAARASSIKQRTEAADLMSTAENRYALLGSQVNISMMDAEQKRELMPLLIEEAKARIEQMGASARNSRALAVLNELEKQGYVNKAEFEEHVGSMGPAGKYILEIMRTLGPGVVQGRPGIMKPLRRR